MSATGTRPPPSVRSPGRSPSRSRRATPTLRPAAPRCGLLFGLAVAAGYLRTRFVPAVLSVLSPAVAVVLRLVSRLLHGRTEGLGRCHRQHRSDEANGTPVVLVIFDEFSGLSLLNSRNQIDTARFPNSPGCPAPGTASLHRRALYHRSRPRHPLRPAQTRVFADRRQTTRPTCSRSFRANTGCTSTSRSLTCAPSVTTSSDRPDRPSAPIPAGADETAGEARRPEDFLRSRPKRSSGRDAPFATGWRG